MPNGWRSRQFGRVVDRFRADCPEDAWDDLLARYAILLTRGPACGPLVAKKLKGGDGIWELLGHADNCQPRLLFYFASNRTIVFVHAFIKKRGNAEYPPAIRLAKNRRAMIQRGEKVANVIHDFGTIH